MIKVIKTFFRAVVYSTKKMSQFLLGMFFVPPGFFIFCYGAELQTFDDLSAAITGIILLWIGGVLIYKSTQE